MKFEDGYRLKEEDYPTALKDLSDWEDALGKVYEELGEAYNGVFRTTRYGTRTLLDIEVDITAFSHDIYVLEKAIETGVVSFG